MTGKLYDSDDLQGFEGLAVKPLPLSLPPFPHLKNGENGTEHTGLRENAWEEPSQGLISFIMA